MKSTKNFECDFFFIRHGESESNVVRGVWSGPNWDAPMTPRGFEQASSLGKRLTSEGVIFDRIYSSSQTRAVQTTKTMLREMNQCPDKFDQVDEIIEQQVPAWRGKRVEDVNTVEVLQQRSAGGKWFVPGDGKGESERIVERRFSNWLEDHVISTLQGQAARRWKIAIVSHGMAMQCLFHYILGYDDRYIGKIQLDNASITRFKLGSRGWCLVSLNDSFHTLQLGDVNRDGISHNEERWGS